VKLIQSSHFAPMESKFARTRVTSFKEISKRKSGKNFSTPPLAVRFPPDQYLNIHWMTTANISPSWELNSASALRRVLRHSILWIRVNSFLNGITTEDYLIHPRVNGPHLHGNISQRIMVRINWYPLVNRLQKLAWYIYAITENICNEQKIPREAGLIFNGHD